MKQNKLDYKGPLLRVPQDSLHTILLERIAACKKPGEDIIKFPAVFAKVASCFSIPKERVWPLLYFLSDLKWINIVFGHGITINYEVMKDG